MDSDFNKLWKPNKRQEEFLSLPDAVSPAFVTNPPTGNNFMMGFLG